MSWVLKYTVLFRRFCENPKQMLNFQPKVKLWTHKRTVSMRRLFCALKTNVQSDCMILYNSCAPREVLNQAVPLSCLIISLR